MRSNRLSLLGIVILVLCFAFFAAHTFNIVWTTPRVIGTAIFAISFPLFLLARWQLGASFSVTPQARSLVTTGLYARIRNPIYLFGGLMVVGMSLFVSPWGPLVVVTILIPLQVYRAGKEEQVLRQAFGEAYNRYKQRTWF
jgi:protein-S-isoprenylcysteine O-methyltransferase Ste14